MTETRSDSDFRFIYIYKFSYKWNPNSLCVLRKMFHKGSLWVLSCQPGLRKNLPVSQKVTG